MWSLLSHRNQVSILVGSGIVVAWALNGGYALVTGHSPGVLHWISLAAIVVAVPLAFVADKLWRPIWERFPFLQRLTFPDLNGKWTGTLISTWVDPATGQPKPPISVTITIRQTLLYTTVLLSTAESTSHSTRAVLESHRDIGLVKIWYSYNNDPKAQNQHRSSPHEGVAFLELNIDADPNRLTGRYYTARKTAGDIDVRKEQDSNVR
jgi:hypothetical protein